MILNFFQCDIVVYCMICVSITHISRLATQLTPMPILSLRLTGWRTSWLLSRTSSRPSPRSWTRPSQRCPDTKTTKIEKTTFYVVTDTKMAARIPRRSAVLGADSDLNSCCSYKIWSQKLCGCFFSLKIEQS